MKPGDRVFVARKVGRANWDDRRMTPTIGRVGTIMVDNGGWIELPDRCFSVMFDDVSLNMNTEHQKWWVYPEESLCVCGSENFLSGHGPDNTHLAQELPP